MLSASGEAGYVHEPFNPNRSPGWFVTPLPQWFMHITRANEDPYLEAVQRMVQLRYPFWPALRRSRRPRILALNLQQAVAAARGRRAGKRLLLKDPLALFSSEWLAERFGMSVVILVRHPAAFVASIKRLNWGFDYERNWLGQPLLMRNLLSDHADDFAGYRGEVDLVGEGIVVWNALYDVVARYRDDHPEWSVIRYEDVASDPLATFHALYDRLRFTWSEDVERIVAAHSSPANPDEVAPTRRHAIRRDSRGASETWKTRLSAPEIARVKQATERVWQRFYSEDDWSTAYVNDDGAAP